MNDALAHERLVGVLKLIDRWGELYNRRWGKRGHARDGSLAAQVDTLIDEVRTRTKLAHDVIAAMGEEALSAKVVENEEGLDGGHPFTQARVAIVEAIAILFSPSDPTPASPRFRLRDVDPASKTWKSAHEGAAALVRGAFMGVRNLVSHPGWPDPTPSEALEMLAVLSYVAHLIQRSDVVQSQ